MASIFVFNSSKEAESDEILLGTPDISEAQSLERHVDRCAMRYRMFSRRLIQQGRSLSRVEIILYALIGWTLLTSSAARSALEFVLAHI